MSTTANPRSDLPRALAEALDDQRRARSRQLQDALHGEAGRFEASGLGTLADLLPLTDHPHPRPLPSPLPVRPVPAQAWEFFSSYAADPYPAKEQYEPAPVTPEQPYVAWESWSRPDLGILSAGAFVSGREWAGTDGNAPHFTGVGEVTSGSLISMGAGASFFQRVRLAAVIDDPIYASFQTSAMRQSSGRETFLDLGGGAGMAAVRADLDVWFLGLNTADSEDFQFARRSINLVTGIASTTGTNLATADALTSITGGMILNPGRDEIGLLISLTVDACCDDGSNAVASIDMALPSAPLFYGVQRGLFGNQVVIPALRMQVWGE